MATPRYENFANGLGILPKPASTNTSMGDIEVLSTGGVLNYHNGTTSSVVVTENHTAVLTNKTLTGNTAVNLVSGAGTFTFNTTGTITAPNTTDTLVTLDLSQVLTNKSLDDTTTSIVDTVDPTKQIKFDAAGTTGTSTTLLSSQTVNTILTLPDATDTLIGAASTNTLTNKSLDDTTTAIVDTVDPTKQIKFDAAGTTGTSTTLLSSQTTNKILTLPDATDTVVVLDLGQVLTNKTLTSPIINTATADTITGIVGGDLNLTGASNQNVNLVTSGTGIVNINPFTFDQATSTMSTSSTDITIYSGAGMGQILNLDAVSTGKISLKNTGAEIAKVDTNGLTMATAKPVILTRNGQTVSLQANAAASASYTIALPASAPAATTVLKYDGSDYVWDTINAGGLGDDLASLQFKASFTDQFDEPAANAISGVDTSGTNATYDTDKKLYRIFYDAGTTIAASTTTTNIELSAVVTGFTAAIGDMVINAGIARKITAVASQSSFTTEAFPIAPTLASQVTVSQAVHSKDVYGSALDGLAISSAFSTSFSEILTDYEDSSTVGDKIFDIGSVPVVGYTASADNTSWSVVSVRPTLETDENESIVLPTSGTALYLRWFANKSSGNGSVNILNYKTFMQRQSIQSDTGTLNSAYAFLNGVGTPVNCSLGISGGKTTVTTTFSFATGITSGTPQGSIDVYINGQLIPRYIDATLTPDGSYTEVNANTIKLDKDYSTYALSVEIIQRSLIIDTNVAYSASVSGLKEINQIGQQPFVNSISNMLSATSSTPTVSQFWSAIVNRAAITDISQDLKVSMGVDRIPVQQAYQLQTEFGANGEPVFAAVNDDRGLIRFVGKWANNNDSSGQSVSTVTTNDFIEVTFYGTALNMMIVPAASMDFRITTDNGAEGSNLAITYATILNARNYNSNTLIPLVSGLTLGVHTVKIRNNAAAGIKTSGFEALNTSTTLKVNPGISYANGNKLTLLAQQSPAYNSTFETGALGTRGGHILVYQKSDGTIAKAVTPTNTSQANTTSADHTNEEVARVYSPREFGANRADDFSTLTSTSSPARVFTLEDGITSLMGVNVGITAFATGAEGVYATNGTSNYYTITFVGTGLDIYTGNNDANAKAMTVSVDGSASIGTISQAANEVGLIKKIVSGLPYGTHIVRFTNANAGVSSPATVQFTVYQPKKPSLPAGAIELADYNILANFTANTTAGLETISTGILRNPSFRELTYFGAGWSVAFDATTATTDINGYQTQTATSGNYYEYTFFGTGFDIRMRANTVFSATNTVSLQAVGGSLLTLNSTNFAGLTTSNYGGATFTYASGNLSTATSTAVGSGFTVSGLTLGLYKVRVATGTAAAFSVNAIDVITPIHSHKSSIVYDQQNTLPVGSQSISDNRVFTPTKDLGAKKKNIIQAVGITSGPTTTSTSAVPMPDMNVVHFNTTGKIKITHFGRLDLTTNAGTVVTNLDGVQVGPFASAFDNTGSNSSTVVYTNIVNVSPGFHKIDLFWYVSSGTLGATGTTRTLIVEEID